MICLKIRIHVFFNLHYGFNKMLLIIYFQIQKLQEAAEMVKSRCENLLRENNLITKNKNKKLEKVSLMF